MLMHIRRFSSDMKTKVPGGHPGLYAVPIQGDRRLIPPEKLDAYAQRVNGLPLLLDTPTAVVAMYFEPHATLDEHSADHPILFLAIDGQGTVRIGGSDGEVHEVCAGEAILWPANQDHMVWTDEGTLQALTIHLPQERGSNLG
jgi:quercetin dioxygenase-like cupin family protein